MANLLDMKMMFCRQKNEGANTLEIWLYMICCVSVMIPYSVLKNIYGTWLYFNISWAVTLTVQPRQLLVVVGTLYNLNLSICP